MIYNLFTDPHLGVSRKAHTTAESSERLNQALFDAALRAKATTQPNICLGDLFDKTFNPERVVIQGIRVASGPTITLAGNHDETNRVGTKCSLEVVEAAGCEVLRLPDISKHGFSSTKCGQVYLVPHHASQELFLKGLADAQEHADQVEGHKYLMVHCNRGDAIGEHADSTLYISRELEDKLLTTFSRVFYGHEHGSHSNKTEGDEVVSKAVVLGNTHPTSFSDISDKYKYSLNTETNTVFRHKIWSKNDHYLEVKLGDVLEPNTDIQFVSVKGNGSRSETVEFIEKCWESFPNAYAIRPEVVFDEEVVRKAEAAEPVNLLSAIEKDLEGTSMLQLFKRIKEEI